MKIISGFNVAEINFNLKSFVQYQINDPMVQGRSCKLMRHLFPTKLQ